METLRLPAQLESLERFRDFVFERLSRSGAPEALFPKIELILEEVLTNVFFYAYRGAVPGDAELGCEIAGGQLRLTVSDRGAEFNPLDNPTPDLTQDIEQRAVGGLGIYFVKQSVDAIAYERQGGCNVLTMSINLSK